MDILLDTTCYDIDGNEPNLVELFELLLKIDKRINPDSYPPIKLDKIGQ